MLNHEPQSSIKTDDTGTVHSIRGSVVDVHFKQHLPAIHTILNVSGITPIILEVLEQRTAHEVRCVALTPTQGLARGMLVVNTNQPLRAPVGNGILSRMFDVFGHTIDQRETLVDDIEWRTVHQAPPSLSESSTQPEVFSTGIKIIDVLMPLERGGKSGHYLKHTMQLVTLGVLKEPKLKLD